MKIRTGFVSNSSSSSFLMYGIYTNKSYDELEELLKGSILSYHSTESGEDRCVGRSWSTVGDNETGKEFKDSIAKELQRLGLGIDGIGTHQEAWRDG